MIETRRDGKYINYFISDQRVSGILTVAQSMIVNNAEAILSCTRIDGS